MGGHLVLAPEIEDVWSVECRMLVLAEKRNKLRRNIYSVPLTYPLVYLKY